MNDFKKLTENKRWTSIYTEDAILEKDFWTRTRFLGKYPKLEFKYK